jgi:hypothetical protein
MDINTLPCCGRSGTEVRLQGSEFTLSNDALEPFHGAQKNSEAIKRDHIAVVPLGEAAILQAHSCVSSLNNIGNGQAAAQRGGEGLTGSSRSTPPVLPGNRQRRKVTSHLATAPAFWSAPYLPLTYPCFRINASLNLARRRSRAKRERVVGVLQMCGAHIFFMAPGYGRSRIIGWRSVHGNWAAIGK